ncbi:hypothetical protein E4O00_01755 [Treponema sp. OMZ 788]|uniref:hypothetical protein n=1 Tax=unclassified Treponema TaxID=2638727 RepID=UPI0020A3B5A3|nr:MULTISPECIES: hypothetical protein [unclassified Treponema]UTC62041.1 hypothetical protein E4O05_11050 [Treponema sp. OMZ 787]UTC64962.1 hypothetical protein E4O00_01755 [Treponema sp. OMZ 788]UTC66189.1 hypothetical protein E4O06_09250 [Treponema sp. OMZ 789]UTC68918.1 hypothetical protein E4O01_09385 [Treponema sp. OMZ 790]UTC71646.1 hypothetical protein E4O02_09575 [Treponema sp. OMZ 791]
MEETIKTLGSAGTAWYFFVIPILFIVYMVFILLKMKGQKNRVSTWLKENPNAVKVYINKTNSTVKMAAAAFHSLTIISVDGDYPLFFTEKLNRGFYVTPGTHIVESSFSKTRPGILYRRVTTTYGPSKQEISVENFKTYNYYFSTAEETYKFEDLT